MDTDFLGDYSDLQEILGGEWNHRAAVAVLRTIFLRYRPPGFRERPGSTGL